MRILLSLITLLVLSSCKSDRKPNILERAPSYRTSNYKQNKVKLHPEFKWSDYHRFEELNNQTFVYYWTVKGDYDILVRSVFNQYKIYDDQPPLNSRSVAISDSTLEKILFDDIKRQYWLYRCEPYENKIYCRWEKVTEQQAIDRVDLWN